MPKPDEFLNRVYGLDGPEKTRDFYRQWADTYDEEMRVNGYASPARVAGDMAAAAGDQSAPLLDLGCGTGLSGEALAAAGFAVIDGTDFSEEMLAAAETKDVYRSLVTSDANDPIPARPGDYANFTAIGVFSPGHAPPDLIAQVVELLPEHGCFGFTLNDHALDEKVYEEAIRESVEQGKVAVASKEYGEHLPKAGIKSMVYVLRRT